MRAELKIVSADLRDAGSHLSHALHIDRAVKSIEAKAKSAMMKSRGKKQPTVKKKIAGKKQPARKKKPTSRAATKRSSKAASTTVEK